MPHAHLYVPRVCRTPICTPYVCAAPLSRATDTCSGCNACAGDDPFWEAASLHYWQTGDLEQYEPEMVTTTETGRLRLTIDRVENRSQPFVSG